MVGDVQGVDVRPREGDGGVQLGGEDGAHYDNLKIRDIVGAEGLPVFDIVSNNCIRSFTKARTEDVSRWPGSSTGSPRSRISSLCSSGVTPSSPLRRLR